jgi:hypothetical protein
LAASLSADPVKVVRFALIFSQSSAVSAIDSMKESGYPAGNDICSSDSISDFEIMDIIPPQKKEGRD